MSEESLGFQRREGQINTVHDNYFFYMPIVSLMCRSVNLSWKTAVQNAVVFLAIFVIKKIFGYNFRALLRLKTILKPWIDYETISIISERDKPFKKYKNFFGRERYFSIFKNHSSENYIKEKKSKFLGQNLKNPLIVKNYRRLWSQLDSSTWGLLNLIFQWFLKRQFDVLWILLL